ncbi:SspB family protein [Oceaniglobus ichthyenteri]|uniref:SspB family protein n=1 Tax=Oceaniglobus ichthyenteri TaxID=2136177 RepID=UPI000D343C96|nr:ClpXP protease specificity-enhancing factor SspB [Oceaniglobus ichthyenteri]
MSRKIDYGNLMHRAMRGLIQEVLNDISERGLPGEHHFFITFDTMHPDVEIADWLSDRYPDEMTVVVQHWYDGLEVTDEGFSITLNFGESPEPLYIPYDAIRTFVDPSVEFGLRFETQTKIAEDDDETEDDTVPDAEPGAAQVVSLDSFRKN